MFGRLKGAGNTRGTAAVEGNTGRTRGVLACAGKKEVKMSKAEVKRFLRLPIGGWYSVGTKDANRHRPMSPGRGPIRDELGREDQHRGVEEGQKKNIKR